MNRFIRLFFVLFIIMAFCVQDGYAFWGKKKTRKKKPQKVEQKIEKEAASVQQKEVKEEVKPVEKVEVKEEKKEEEPKEEKAPQIDEKAQAKKKRSEELQKKIEKEKKLRRKKRKQLNNSLWEIEIKAIGAQSKAQTDSLIFEDNRFYSDKSSKEGFNATNYTISIKDEDTVVWETMQTAEEGRINFWRGEITENMKSMRGIVSKKDSEGKSVNYSFTSTGKKAVK